MNSGYVILPPAGRSIPKHEKCFCVLLFSKNMDVFKVEHFKYYNLSWLLNISMIQGQYIYCLSATESKGKGLKEKPVVQLWCGRHFASMAWIHLSPELMYYILLSITVIKPPTEKICFWRMVFVPPAQFQSLVEAMRMCNKAVTCFGPTS